MVTTILFCLMLIHWQFCHACPLSCYWKCRWTLCWFQRVEGNDYALEYYENEHHDLGTNKLQAHRSHEHGNFRHNDNSVVPTVDTLTIVMNMSALHSVIEDVVVL